MDIYIYFPTPIGPLRDEIETVLDEALEGIGEVTGGGSGEQGSNIDVEIFEDLDQSHVDTILDVLRRHSPPPGTYIRIGELRVDVN